MITNRKMNKRTRQISARAERVVYKIDKDGNFSETKESMRSLYDANFREGRNFDKKNNRKSFRK